MICICIRQEGDRNCVWAHGHAGSAPMGKDLVCAAVSTLLQCLAENLAQYEDRGECRILRQRISSGYLILDVVGCSSHMAAVFNAFMVGLRRLAREHPDCILVGENKPQD